MSITQRIDLDGATEIDWTNLPWGQAESPEILRRLQRSFQLAQEVGRIGLFEIDMRTGVTYANPVFLNISACRATACVCRQKNCAAWFTPMTGPPCAVSCWK